MIKAGTLRHVVNIQTPSVEKNDVGEDVVNWTDFIVDYPAQVNGLSGGELEAARQTHAEAQFEIRLRYPADGPVTTTMRIKYDGRYFDVLHVNNIRERNRELVILAKEQL